MRLMLRFGLCISLVAFLLPACGSPQELSNLNEADQGIFVALEANADSQSFVTISTSAQIAAIAVCTAPAASCVVGAPGYYVATQVGENDQRRFFKTQAALALQADQILRIGIPGATGVPLRVLKSVRIRPRTGGTTVPEGQAGDVVLTVGDVFDQGNSNWCWAYSAFHTLRAYYVESGRPSSTGAAWRDALQKLNTPQAFRQYMAARVGTYQMGDPQDFVRMIERDYKLTADGWEGASPTQGVMTHVQANLRKGIPTAFCNPSHCMMIYGFKTDGQKATAYDIGDSMGGRKYRVNAQSLASQLDMVMTLP